MAKEVLLTQSGYESLVERLEYLKTEKRAEVAENITTVEEAIEMIKNSIN